MSAGLQHCLQAFRSSTLSGTQCCSPTASPIGCSASSAKPDFVRASPDLLDSEATELYVTVTFNDDEVLGPYTIPAQQTGPDSAKTTERYFLEFYSGTDYFQSENQTITVTFTDDVALENPNLTDGGFRLQRLRRIQEYEWDYRNQLVQAAVYGATAILSDRTFPNPHTPDLWVTTEYLGRVQYLYL